MKQVMTEGERLSFLVDNLSGGNQADFSRRTSLDKTTLNRLISGKAQEFGLHLNELHISKICNTFPQVNAQFLRDGVTYPGDLTVYQVKETYERRLAEKDIEIERLRSELERYGRIIDSLMQK